MREKIKGKLLKLTVRAYHRPTEPHQNEKAYRRKGRKAQAEIQAAKRPQDWGLSYSGKHTIISHS